MRKKYYKSRSEAIKACAEINKTASVKVEVFRMPKGSRKSGWYAVCDYMEYLNTY
jgi:hypothetical protein